MPVDIGGTEAKFARARDHLETLEGEADTFLSTNPYEIPAEPDPQTREQVVRFKVVREPDDPTRWALVAGEFAFNLRCALDHLVFQLVIASGKNPDARGFRTQFPIYTDQTDYLGEKIGKGGKRDTDLKGVDVRFRSVIDGVQPHQRGKMADHDPLAQLSWLNNRDKHRVLHPCLVQLETVDAPLERTDLVGGQGTDAPQRIEGGRVLNDGDELFRFPFGERYAYIYAEPTVRVGFGSLGLSTARFRAIFDYVEASVIVPLTALL